MKANYSFKQESNLGENSVLHAVLKRRTDSAQSLDASKMPENHNELMSNGLDSEERNHTATCKGPKSESSCLGNDSHLPEFDINFTEPESGHKDYVDPDLTLTKGMCLLNNALHLVYINSVILMNNSTSEGCFIFDFNSLPLEVTQPI